MTIGHWILIQASFHELDRGYVDTGSVCVKSMVIFGSSLNFMCHPLPMF